MFRKEYHNHQIKIERLMTQDSNLVDFGNVNQTGGKYGNE